MDRLKHIKDRVDFLYASRSQEVFDKLTLLFDRYETIAEKPWVSEHDAILITYGDTLSKTGEAPLVTLKRFLDDHTDGEINDIHILPFCPYTSDDGFAVIDYKQINPSLGSWGDVRSLAADYDLMFDAVVNHISSKSPWFLEYLSGNPKYQNYFIEADPTLDYSMVTRPRALPLLTEVETPQGTKHVWTTFSADQIDLNFQDPDLLIEMMDVLLMYATNGARFIRLDAIGFAWKQLGTSCMHLKETHELVKLMRDVVEVIAPGTILITETNVPHLDNIAYFGNGHDEAQMVYQFPLPPLTLYSFLTGDASKLSQWADSLDETTSDTSYFNFLASHDGIGMRPTEGILSDAEKQIMVDHTLNNGGRVNFKFNADGSKSPYELNINFMDALTPLSEHDDLRAKKMLAAQVILLSVIGVPGIYIHSLLGSRNDYKGLEASGINRRINREKLSYDQLVAELEAGLRHTIFSSYKALLKIRKSQSAFNPRAKQVVEFIDDRLFAIKRVNEDTDEEIFVLVNVSQERVEVSERYKGIDIVANQTVDGAFTMSPYQYMWVKKSS